MPDSTVIFPELSITIFGLFTESMVRLISLSTIEFPFKMSLAKRFPTMLFAEQLIL